MELKGCACPVYINAWCDMMSEKDRAPDDFNKLQIITKFAAKYTMLPHYSSKLLKLAKECYTTLSLDYFTFLYSTKYGDQNAKHIEWAYPSRIIKNLQNENPRRFFMKAEDAMAFPHKWQKDLQKYYQCYTTRPISKAAERNHQKYEKLYAKMISCENDIDEWLKCMDEIENIEAVIANFELKLGQSDNWTKKIIWDAYFQFLKENNSKEILEVYRKYTRLFICDKDAVEEYRNEIEKYSMWNVPTTKYWIDTVKYEMHFGDLKFAYVLLQRAVKAIFGQNIKFSVNDLFKKLEKWEREMKKTDMRKKAAMERKNKENATKQNVTLESSVCFTKPQQSQHFFFRRSFIQHLMKSASGYILRKLYASCKFFYAFHKTRLCYRLEITKKGRSQYFDESLYLNENAYDDSLLHKLNVYGLLLCIDSKNQNFLSSILQKVNSCRVTRFFIRDQNITFNEFLFLLLPEIRQVFMYDVNVSYDDKMVDGMHIFNYTKSKTKFKHFEFFDKKSCISCNCGGNESSSIALRSYKSGICEIVYIDGKEIKIQCLASLLESTNLKRVTIKNTSVKKADGNTFSPKEIEHFVKDKVAKNVIVEIN